MKEWRAIGRNSRCRGGGEETFKEVDGKIKQKETPKGH